MFEVFVFSADRHMSPSGAYPHGWGALALSLDS